MPIVGGITGTLVFGLFPTVFLVDAIFLVGIGYLGIYPVTEEIGMFECSDNLLCGFLLHIYERIIGKKVYPAYVDASRYVAVNKLYKVGREATRCATLINKEAGESTFGYA